MRTLLSPAEGYPIVMIDADVVVPDFGFTITNGSYGDAVNAIHEDLRKRKLESAYYPFPSRPSSLLQQYERGTVAMVNTHGWDTPVPLAVTEEE